MPLSIERIERLWESWSRWCVCWGAGGFGGVLEFASSESCIVFPWTELMSNQYICIYSRI